MSTPAALAAMVICLAPASAGPEAAGAAKASTRPAGGAAAAWPGRTDGLVFLWRDGSRANQVPAGATGKRTCRARPRGRAIFGSAYDMDLAGGAFLAERAGEPLLAACRKTGQLAVEAVITPGRLQQPAAAPIVTFSAARSERNFALVQDGNQLVLRLRTPSNGPGGAKAQPVLYTLTARRPVHVVVSYAAGRAVCCVDGQQVATSRAVRGDFSNWAPGHHLLFGDEWDGGRDWAGRLEGIAIYSRFVGAAEARRKHELYARELRKRRPIRRLVLVGKCVETTPTPTLRAIRPYRRCLAAYTYDVQKVLHGRYDERQIIVAHWVILDGKAMGFDRRKGRTCRLTVEPYDAHRQLSAERLVMDQDLLDPQIHYDVER